MSSHKKQAQAALSRLVNDINRRGAFEHDSSARNRKDGRNRETGGKPPPLPQNLRAGPASGRTRRFPEAHGPQLDRMEGLLQKLLDAVDAQEKLIRNGSAQVADEAAIEEARADLDRRDKALREAEKMLDERERFLEESEALLLEKGQELIETETGLEQMKEDLGSRK